MLVSTTIFNFMAFRYLQLDEALAILFATPFLVAILAGPLLGEWVGWRRWTAIVVGLHRRAGGDPARPQRRHAMGGAVLGRQRRSSTPPTASPPAWCRAPTPARRRCSTPTWSAWWSWLPVLPFVWTAPPSWLDLVLMVAMGALGVGRSLPADRWPTAGRRPRCCRRSSTRRSSGPRRSAIWCSPTCPPNGPDRRRRSWSPPGSI